MKPTTLMPDAGAVAQSLSCESNDPNLITIGSNVRQPERIQLYPLEGAMQAIQSGITPYGDIRERIRKIRSNTHPDTGALKSGLPWFCGSEIQGRRGNQNVVQARYMVFDLDHVADIGGTKASAIMTLHYVRYAFRSVNDGVKLVVALDKAITEQEQFRHCYRLIAAEISARLGLECDTTSDWARACFFSFDPAILDRKNCKPFAVVDLPLITPPPVTTAPSFQSLPSDPQSEYQKAEQVVLQLVQLDIPYHEWIQIGFALKSGFGAKGKALWDYFMDCPHYENSGELLNQKWRSFGSRGATTIATLYHIAKKYGVTL